MNDFKCPMCTDCPDNCPLDNEEDTREHSSDYYKGRADALKELKQKQRTIIDDDGVMYKVVFLEDIEDLKAEVEE